MMIYDTVQLKKTLNELKTSLSLLLCLILLQDSPNTEFGHFTVEIGIPDKNNLFATLCSLEICRME